MTERVGAACAAAARGNDSPVLRRSVAAVLPVLGRACVGFARDRGSAGEFDPCQMDRLDGSVESRRAVHGPNIVHGDEGSEST